MLLRVAFLILCLVVYSIGAVSDSTQQTKRKRSRARNIVYPYFELTLGGMYSTSEYKTKSEKNFYHDLERGEMVYDKELYYDLYSFDGGGPSIDFRAGVLFVKRFAIFLDFGCFWSIGDYRYKYYSLDKEEFVEKAARTRIQYGFGFRVYPFANELSKMYGTFIGTTIKGVELLNDEDAWEKYGMTYVGSESGLQFEMGKVWKLSEHYFIGAALNFMFCWSEYQKEDKDVFRIGEKPRREDDITLNSLHFGLAVTIVRK